MVHDLQAGVLSKSHFQCGSRLLAEGGKLTVYDTEGTWLIRK